MLRTKITKLTLAVILFHHRNISLKSQETLKSIINFLIRWITQTSVTVVVVVIVVVVVVIVIVIVIIIIIIITVIAVKYLEGKCGKTNQDIICYQRFKT